MSRDAERQARTALGIRCAGQSVPLSVKNFALPEWKTYKINRLHICDSIRVDEEQDSYTIGFLTDPVAVVTSSAGRTS